MSFNPRSRTGGGRNLIQSLSVEILISASLQQKTAVPRQESLWCLPIPCIFYPYIQYRKYCNINKCISYWKDVTALFCSKVHQGAPTFVSFQNSLQIKAYNVIFLKSGNISANTFSNNFRDFGLCHFKYFLLMILNLPILSLF